MRRRLGISEKNQNDSVKKALSASDINSKIYDPKTSKEEISNPIHSGRQKAAIKEEVQNQENHYTWKYYHFVLRNIVVGCKQDLRVKYHADNMVT